MGVAPWVRERTADSLLTSVAAQHIHMQRRVHAARAHGQKVKGGQHVPPHHTAAGTSTKVRKSEARGDR